MSPMVKLALTMEHALLGFVRQQPVHAYEIHQQLLAARNLGLVWRLKQSQLYALLNRLEAEDYLTSTPQPQGSRPPRKVLALTPAGRAAFEDWLRRPVSHGRDFRLEFLAKLYFALEAGAETVATLLSRQRSACERWLIELDQQIAPSGGPVFDHLVLEFRRSQITATLAWLDTCAATLRPPAS